MSLFKDYCNLLCKFIANNKFFNLIEFFIKCNLFVLDIFEFISLVFDHCEANFRVSAISAAKSSDFRGQSKILSRINQAFKWRHLTSAQKIHGNLGSTLFSLIIADDFYTCGKPYSLFHHKGTEFNSHGRSPVVLAEHRH